ncbi:hypothetical protein V5R04_07135 [Jonesiaceae bacterium BS-20]|uniref:Uncharacterized protein n=1 Tax=Jonesiaceae bacterium BS-20 TaxID=3120821 RepID=A0AAU7E0A3_9MICO
MSAKHTLVVAMCILTAACSSEVNVEKIEQEYASLDFSILETNAEQVVTCVELRTGFLVTADKDGSVGYLSRDVPESQHALVDEAIPECFEDLGFSDSEEPSETQKERLLGLQLEARKCLQGLGFEIPEPPSLSTYIEDYGGPDHWAPWRYMGNYQMSHEKSLEIFEQCPDPVSLVQ